MNRIDIPKFAKISILLLLVFFLIAVIIITVGESNLFKKKKLSFDENFTLHQSLVAPEPPSTPDEYYLVRPKDYTWTEQDIDRWFSPPDEQLLDALRAANDELISDLLEVAP